MKSNRSELVELAEELEDALETCPPAERGALLIEAGEYRTMAGDYTRAAELFDEAIALGGLDAANARVCSAEMLFDQGRDDDARAALEALRSAEVADSDPFIQAGELLEERGELDAALAWFDLAVARIPAEEMADYRATGISSEADATLHGRRRVRRALGAAVDELDELADGSGARRIAHMASLALEFEADAAREPEQRAEFLLEAAIYWLLAEEFDRAIERFSEIVEVGGEFGALARVGLAEVYFRQARDAEARVVLEALRAQTPTFWVACGQAGILLEEHGSVTEALDWYDFTLRHTPEEEIEAWIDGEDLPDLEDILVRRREIRADMDLEPDELDDLVDQLADLDEDEELVPDEIHVPFWLREELPLAHNTWPDMFADVDTDAAMRQCEAICQATSEAGVPRVLMVPLTVAALTEVMSRTGGDEAEDPVEQLVEERIAAGAAITWPPPRNEPCWCGSGVKYKKCCGSPE